MDKKNKPFTLSLNPFIWNISRKDNDPMIKKIDENGNHNTIDKDIVEVEVAESEELTPEAQEELLEESY